ncbi:MAG: TRAP transporter substrate-binding protein [Candidatus Brocadiia bacterium]|nr:MAG: TRAP transporter substrate-binding protein [Candidatus Brocadiia bacterium]
MKNFKQFITIISLTAFVLTGFLAIHGKAQALELKFGHVGAPGSLFQICVDEFVKQANAKLGGKATVTAFGSSQLGSDSELLKKLKLGTVDFALPSTVMSSVVDQFGVFELPYLVKDRNHMRKIRDKVFEPKLAPLVEKKGYQVIAVWENGFREITNNKRPINVPEDLRDLKLRTPKGEWRVKMFKAYGANPSPMALSEVFVALQTGVMDGQENPLAQIYSQKFHEVQKYLSLTGHVYTPAYVLVGSNRWPKLPADVRDILRSVAVDTQEFVYATAEKMENDLLEKMKKSAIKVNSADKDAFIRASDGIYKEFGNKVSGALKLINDIQALAK